ncbi:DNA replication complex GINS protein PSF1-like isoform X1 [Salvia divinorum]|uniref:DNA replication complex GINS protein PSF1-like isoform X1 n=1 Tax=Salvia divinorum TaxID=28513 RepID=A0ABD1I8K4_SALDI
MYGREAIELVKEFASVEHRQIFTFNNGLFAQVLSRM